MGNFWPLFLTAVLYCAGDDPCRKPSVLPVPLLQSGVHPGLRRAASRGSLAQPHQRTGGEATQLYQEAWFHQIGRTCVFKSIWFHYFWGHLYSFLMPLILSIIAVKIYITLYVMYPKISLVQPFIFSNIIWLNESLFFRGVRTPTPRHAGRNSQHQTGAQRLAR